MKTDRLAEKVRKAVGIAALATTLVGATTAAVLMVAENQNRDIENYVFQVPDEEGVLSYVVRDSNLYRLEDNIRNPVSDPELKNAIYRLYSSKINDNRVVFYREPSLSPPRPKPTDLEAKIRYVHVLEFVAR